MNIIKIVIPLLCIPFSHEEKIDIDFMEAIIDQFDMKHPNIVLEDNAINVRLMKRLFKKGHYLNIDFSLSSLGKTYVPPTDVIINIHGSNDKGNYSELLTQKSLGKVMIIPNDDEDFTNVKNTLQVDIDQQVFLLNKTTNEVFEIYHIQDHHVYTKLGKFGKITQAFIWNENVKRDLLERRSNLHGITLKAMTETTGKTTILDPRYVDEAKLFLNNQTYLVDGFFSGLFYDILIELQNQLNFTTNIYKRKKRSWGFVNRQPNGSYVGTGMVGDLFFNRADLVVAPLTLTPQRAKYIDYLLPLQPLNLGLYIPSGSSRGNFDFDMLLSPFR